MIEPLKGLGMVPYVGDHDRKDPVLSPIYADLKGFPPTLCMTSTRDHYLSGTTDFHRALLRAGVDARLLVFDAMPHAFGIGSTFRNRRKRWKPRRAFSTTTSADAPMMTTAPVLLCWFGVVKLAAAAGTAIKTTPGEFVIDTPMLGRRISISASGQALGL